jgi:serine/threonine protein kinase
LTPLADVWSCGIILFAMVTGFLPFEDSNVSILYKKIILLNYEIPNFLSSLIKNLI